MTAYEAKWNQAIDRNFNQVNKQKLKLRLKYMWGLTCLKGSKK